MTWYDVFNGDADGICALQQLRLADPQDSILISGVKRDIKLLDRLEAQAGDHLCVLDISLDKNRDALQRLLMQGAQIQYFDHHFAGDIPQHASLETHIDTSSSICTSLLVNHYLQNRYPAWAITGAYGDNLYASADLLARQTGLGIDESEAMKELGTYLNYNGYGSTLEDLYFTPDELYRRVKPYDSPLDFIANDEAFVILKNGYAEDMAQGRTTKPAIETERHALILLPDAPWARRVSGVLANEMARSAPDRAHALVNTMADGSLRVSVRAPLNRRSGAEVLCMAFPTGGGRQAAAGINKLPPDQYDAFVEKFTHAFAG
ncbi:MAG TPA: acetyltransferase [Gammaproteobacteria bacterium]|nr:acetyltransferase [Gammaproteobacteria bacterium]